MRPQWRESRTALSPCASPGTLAFLGSTLASTGTPSAGLCAVITLRQYRRLTALATRSQTTVSGLAPNWLEINLANVSTNARHPYPQRIAKRYSLPTSLAR
jgi:hypothetical protein